MEFKKGCNWSGRITLQTRELHPGWT
jgi:hypothetical protein